MLYLGTDPEVKIIFNVYTMKATAGQPRIGNRKRIEEQTTLGTKSSLIEKLIWKTGCKRRREW